MTMCKGLETRKVSEREFHDRLAKELSRLGKTSPNEGKRVYSITKRGDAIVHEWIIQNSNGKRVLDYCCGTGQWSLEFANNGASVYGIDISKESVALASNSLRRATHPGKATFMVMDAERLAFKERTFDLILCAGALHHLDSVMAFRELSRVLKVDGQLLCVEPLGYNPLINLYRRMTPQLRTPWESEHVFGRREIFEAGQHFRNVDVRFLYLFTIVASYLSRTGIFKLILRFLDRLDSYVLQVPGVQLMAWQVMLLMTRPRSQRKERSV
jgi:SAM-dependent methyltransferase